MPLLFGVLAMALVLVAAGPALAQAVDDQYGSGGSGAVGEDAANAAVTASQAWEAASGGSEEDASISSDGTVAASTAEESGSASEDDSEGEERRSDEGVAEGEEAGSGEDVPEGEESGEDVPEGITKLPETGGPSILSLGILLVIGGVLVRGLTRGVFRY